MNVPFLQDTTFTGLISTKNYGTSQDWSQAYNLVQANSATWEESSEVIPTVTAYLSTNFVTLCSTDSKGQILSAGVPLHNIFLTAETDSQILNYNTTTELLSISNGNSVSLASLNDKGYINTNFFPLSGGIISGATRINNDLTVFGNLTATGTTTFANTVFSVTSALSVVHIGSGPAMWVGNNGTGDIASFYDIDENLEVLHVGGNNGTFPNVGVKTSEPNKDLTVNGELSASSTIYDATGNSTQWNQAYNTGTVYQTTSGQFALSAHSSTHHTGGTDAIAAHQINGQTIFGTGNATYSTDQTLAASRAFQFTVGNTNAGGILLTLPTAAQGTINGDTIVIIGGALSGPITIRRINVLSPLIYETLATITAAGQQYSFRSSGASTGGWSLVLVDTHTHPSTQITGLGTASQMPSGSFAPSNLYQNLSGSWQSTFVTVCALSASWGTGGGGGTDLASVTNYLSTNNVLVSGLSVAGNISAIGSVISRIPLVFTELSAYTLSLTDQSDLITINNSLTSFVYIPNDTSVNFGDGSQINITRLGSGTVTISALDGVVLRSADNRNQLRTQNSTATIVKLSANDWLLFGDIS